MEMIVDFIALAVILLGVVMVYDARTITKKIFGFGDQNQAAWGLKILGFIVAIIGTLIKKKKKIGQKGIQPFVHFFDIKIDILAMKKVPEYQIQHNSFPNRLFIDNPIIQLLE